MTDDIEKYLRLTQTRYNRHAEAADEIERLRKMAYAMIDELRQNGGYESYTTQMLFNEFYEQAVRGE